MHKFSEEFMTIIERKFILFLTTSIIGLKKDYYRKERKRTTRELLFDKPKYWNEKLAYYDEIFQDNVLETDNKALFIALKSLTPRQLQVICLIELDDLTEKEVAKRFLISQQGIHKVKAGALKKLKRFLHEGLDHNEVIRFDLESNC